MLSNLCFPVSNKHVTFIRKKKLQRNSQRELQIRQALLDSGSLIASCFAGIRRKRLKGDTWAYKKICEEILKEADI